MSKNFTTIYISSYLDGSGKFSRRINVPFIPKTVTVRSMFYYNLGLQEDEVGVLSSDLIDSLDGALFTFYDGISIDPNIRFRCDKPVNGVFDFHYNYGPNHTGAMSFALTFRD